jgi:hypothetical protein
MRRMEENVEDASNVIARRSVAQRRAQTMGGTDDPNTARRVPRRQIRELIVEGHGHA